MPSLLRYCCENLLSLAFPPQCVACERGLRAAPTDRATLCEDCRGDLVLISEPFCRKCGAPTPLPNAAECPHCLGENWKFEATFALGQYEGLLRLLVLQAKSVLHESAAWTLGRLIVEERGELLQAWGATLVLAVPMHWRRRLVRQSNSPEIIAERIARDLSIPAPRRILRRDRHTPRQALSAPSIRRLNLRNAFSVYSPETIQGARILLVDDVLTTGATAHSAAATLIEAGAKAVAMVVAARSIT